MIETSLEVMLFGMLGIFLVMGIMIGVVSLLKYFGKKNKQ